jgi:quaternary ammonium compound-resistance protein SugE
MNLTTSLPWLAVSAAGLLEIAFAVGLKSFAASSRPWTGVGALMALAGSLMLLSYGLRQLPVGTAYAVWTGIGAAGTALFGIVALQDSSAPARLVCIGLILCGVMGLKLFE